ncbi:MAG: T9SS type A sorting domain-containing protein, partial [Cytophagia bacterium]|nr:T9SS type A sorting domain-containing protein [Cytophagia bacterium]
GDITISSNAGINTVSITGEAEVVAGIEDPIILPSQVKLYPNPASQFVEIDLTDLNGIPADLSIKSINGVDMWNKKEVKESNVSVDISSYADGAYLILVQTDRGTVAKRLLIKK